MRITIDGVAQPDHGAGSLLTAPEATEGHHPERGMRFAANEPAKIRSPVNPFKLELDLLFVPLSFVLDVELGTSGHVDPFSGHLNLESLTLLQGVGQPAQLRYELGRGVDLLDVPVVLFAHRFSLGSINHQPLVSYRVSKDHVEHRRPTGDRRGAVPEDPG